MATETRLMTGFPRLCTLTPKWSDHQSDRTTGREPPMKKRSIRLLGAMAALALLAACGSDDDDNSSSAETTAAASATTAGGSDTTAGSETTAAGSETTTGGTVDASALDNNGDGKVVFGIAAAGPADDGAYYQAVVDEAKSVSADNGFEDPIVVDNIQAADAATAMSDLAEQGVDVIIVGASEIAEPLPQLVD